MSAWGDIRAAEDPGRPGTPLVADRAPERDGKDADGLLARLAHAGMCKRCAGLIPAHFLTCPTLRLGGRP